MLCVPSLSASLSAKERIAEELAAHFFLILYASVASFEVSVAKVAVMELASAALVRRAGCVMDRARRGRCACV